MKFLHDYPNPDPIMYPIPTLAEALCNTHQILPVKKMKAMKPIVQVVI
jgi:hypothetical protein